MAISDASAIRWCNEYGRPAADRIVRCYRLLKELNANWTAMQGTNDERFAVFRKEIQRVATAVSNTYFFVSRGLVMWDGQALGGVIPNDAAEIVQDGAPSDGRQQISGQDVVRVRVRMREFEGWLADPTGTFATTDQLRDNAKLRQFLRIAQDGHREPTAAWGAAVAVTLAGELVTEYETTNPAFLVHLRRLAVVESD